MTTTRRRRSHPGDRPAGAGRGGASRFAPGLPRDVLRCARAALEAALEAVPSPAFFVRAPATVLAANARGTALLAEEREAVEAALAARGDPANGAPLRIVVNGLARFFVAALQDAPAEPGTRLAVVSGRWRLTPRQRAVLALVARGASNRAAAEQLACSEKTVELHVSAVLAKARCASRAELIARFWTESI